MTEDFDSLTPSQMAACVGLMLAVQSGGPSTNTSVDEMHGMMERAFSGEKGPVKSAVFIAACDDGLVVGMVGSGMAMAASAILLDAWMDKSGLDADAAKATVKAMVLRKLAETFEGQPTH